MAKPIDNAAREQRLAAKLRENLHRRKAQARALDGGDAAPAGDAPINVPCENDADALSKQPPES